MTFIEGIGDEVVQFLVGLFFVLVVVLAWFTTNISNDRTLRTVFLLDRRRLRAVRRFITHTESSTIVEGSTADSSEANQTTPRVEEDKPTSTCTENTQSATDETRIVETMDAPDNIGVDDGLRRRINLANADETNNASSNGGDTSNEITNNEVIPGGSKIENENKKNDKIRVKLKYVTDELRHVDASLKENIGDFKRQHFQAEYAANKLVKLIFNGQILQRDGDTLQSCGLFDNCVVHCVFLPGATSPSGTSSGDRNSNSTPQGYTSRSTNTNQQNEWHLENFLLAVLCCFLGAAWYLRYVYSHIYTVTATIGLILMTGIFTIVMFGMHFPDNVEVNQERTENVETR